MPDTSPRLVSLNDVCAMTSLSRTAINKHRAAGTFPKEIPLTERRIAFVRSEVEQWIADRIATARGRAA
ncbi:MAG: AlpA family phage regulatory protein [Mesorhizobium sp.]|nr:AlpA family phage regulatory protein [Mesorhizobium sp.]